MLTVELETPPAKKIWRSLVSAMDIDYSEYTVEDLPYPNLQSMQVLEEIWRGVQLNGDEVIREGRTGNGCFQVSITRMASRQAVIDYRTEQGIQVQGDKPQEGT